MALTQRAHTRRALRAAGYGPDTNRRGRVLDSELAARLDWVLIGACALIAVFGLFMVYSSTRNLLDDPFYYVKRQAVALLLGVGVAIGILRVDYRKFRDFSLLAYVVTVALLFFVLTPMGSSSKGATSWYELPFDFQFQPSEIAKFGLIVALAGYVNEHRGDIDPWRFTVIVALAMVPLGLVQLQPDLGTNMVLMMIVLGVLAIAGVNWRYLVILLLLGITGIYAVVSLGILKEYQLDRLTTVNALGGGGGGDGKKGGGADKPLTGSAYNQDQSVKTIGSGGFSGQGYLKGSQTKLGYVPEQHTDFIFTAVGEELGFIGAGALLILFAIVLWRTWRIAQLARDYYGTLVCGGVLAMFTFMIFENIGMAMGIMPVAGIPLPFMSYGGSSLISACACMALVANVHANRFS
jgi:rod shape determining protein RodA